MEAHDNNKETAELISALISATAEVAPIVKDRVAEGKFSYHYANLADVLAVVRPALAAHGLAIIQDVTMVEGSPSITTTVWHRSGSRLTFGPLTMPCDPSSAHSIGSAITYGRRYAVLAALGLAADDDDDDGAAAMAARGGGQQRQQRQQPKRDPDAVRRAEKLFAEIKSLPEQAKGKLREWAEANNRKVTVQEMASDPAWLESVGAQVARITESFEQVDELTATVAALDVESARQVAATLQGAGFDAVDDALADSRGRGVIRAALMALGEA